MDSSVIVTAVRLVAAVSVLSYTSILDWRTRKIGNIYWIALSAFGLALLPIQILIDDQPIVYILVLIPILAILSDVYWDSPEGAAIAKYAPIAKYAIAILSIVLLGYEWAHDPYFQHLLAAPVMMIVIVMMYTFDILRGGADAKAFLALSIMFPFYPSIGSFPLTQASNDAAEVLFPFSFTILVMAAIIVALFPLGFATRNLANREFRFPQGFLGYKMNAGEIQKKHVWLMERIEGGKHVVYARPRAEEDLDKEVALLANAGFKRIWVTPKVPFIIPTLAALVFSAVFGSVLVIFTQV